MGPGFSAATGEWSVEAPPATSAGRLMGRPGTLERKSARASQRTPHRVPCRVKLYDSASGQPTAMVGQTTNLSSSGFAVLLNLDVRPGTWVEALVPHFSGDPMFVCGTVAHTRRILADAYEIGVQFTHDSPPPVF